MDCKAFDKVETNQMDARGAVRHSENRLRGYYNVLRWPDDGTRCAVDEELARLHAGVDHGSRQQVRACCDRDVHWAANDESGVRERRFEREPVFRDADWGARAAATEGARVAARVAAMAAVEAEAALGAVGPTRPIRRLAC